MPAYLTSHIRPLHQGNFTANIYFFKVNSRNTEKRCETCSKITVKASEWCQ